LRERSVTLSFNADDMKVVDLGASDSERKDIEATMKGAKMLDGIQFRAISFSSNFARARELIATKLLAHSRSTASLARSLRQLMFHDGAYTGSLTLKQTDYGITLIRIAGDTVLVKDEITIQFAIGPASEAAAKGAR
jgi:hypothetical protein